MSTTGGYDSEKHHRRSVRLNGWDYAQNGAHFVTICTRNRELLFEDPVLADILLETWQELPERFPTIALDDIVIMPNHVHFIVWLNPGGTSSNDAPANGAATGDRTGFGCPRWDRKSPALGEAVRTFKALVTRRFHQRHPEIPFAWQRSYYDRIIRNEKGLNAFRRYILENLIHWAEDSENPGRRR